MYKMLTSVEKTLFLFGVLCIQLIPSDGYEVTREFNITPFNNPEELGSYGEGDIRFPKSVTSLDVKKWENGFVPYKINGEFTKDEKEIIEDAMTEISANSCIIFQRHWGNKSKDHISFESERTGCWSSVGRIGGKQVINLQRPTCVSQVGTPLHQIMHALGFWHEHNSVDRDEFVEIHFENVAESRKSNFDHNKWYESFGMPYDYDSVMHYSNFADTKNGKPTILIRDPHINSTLGQRSRLSTYDILKLQRAYCDPLPRNGTQESYYLMLRAKIGTALGLDSNKINCVDPQVNSLAEKIISCEKL